MTTMLGLSRMAAAMLLVSSLAAGRQVSAQGLVELQSVRVVNEGGRVTVIIEANGALPQPAPGSLDNPPRLFFDFSGVAPRRRGIVTAAGSGVVRQTRVALNSVNVTRVVLDLAQVENYRVDDSERGKGRITIAVGPESTATRTVPPPSSATPPKPMEHVPPPSTAPAAPSRPAPVPNPPAASSAPAPAASVPAAAPKPSLAAPPASTPPPPSTRLQTVTQAPSTPTASTTTTAAPTPAAAAPATTSPTTTPPAAAPSTAPPPNSTPSPATPPAIATPPADKPAAPAPAGASGARRRPVFTPPPMAPRPPASEIERYRKRIPGAVERLEAQQPIVMLIDAEGSISSEALQAAMTEFTTIRRMLDGVKPSEAMASAHELLIASCTLGATASRLSIEATRDRNEEAKKNAASAAAGALMFFERACADLGCIKPQQ